MAGINIHSASPLSSRSSQQSLLDDKTTSYESAKLRSSGSSTPESNTMEDLPLLLEAEADLPQQDSSTVSQSTTSVLSPKNQRSVRAAPRLDTRKASIAAPLPWKVDETSSPYTPISQGRKPSFAPPPRASHRASIDTTNSASISSHKLPLLSSPAAPGTPPTYKYPASASPYSSGSHGLDLSHPPGYTQDSHTSFSDRDSIQSGSVYSNHSPFYTNNSNYGSPYSHNSSIASPSTPTRRGRGILDNDPNLYLRGEEEGDEESVWDTAAKWAKAAGKRLSASEQTIWKMVNAATNSEGDRA